MNNSTSFKNIEIKMEKNEKKSNKNAKKNEKQENFVKIDKTIDTTNCC